MPRGDRLKREAAASLQLAAAKCKKLDAFFGKLGLLRKRSTTSQQERNLKKAGKTCQNFAYLIVIDFESTCWKDKRNAGQEIIEFPAVLLNTSSGEVESEFHTYVLPEENPILSDFCSDFTGISQAQVESGAPLSVCLSQFSRWLKRLEAEKSIAYNTSQDETKKLCTFVTWSDWDLGVCLHYECKRKQLVKPPALTSWIDLRATYKNFYQRKPQGLHGALQDVGIEFHGRQHSGLDDSRNTAKLAWRMMCDGCVMKITRTMQRNSHKRPPVAIHKHTMPIQTGAEATQVQGSRTTSRTANAPIVTAPTYNSEYYQEQSVKMISGHSYTPCDGEARANKDIYTYVATESQAQQDEDLVAEEFSSDDIITATQAIAWQDKFGNTACNLEQMDAKNLQPTSNVMIPDVVLGIDTPCSTSGHITGSTLGAKSIVSVKTCLGTLTEIRPAGLTDQSTSKKNLKRSSPLGNGTGAKIRLADGKLVGKSDNTAQGTGSKHSPPLWSSFQSKSSTTSNQKLTGGFKTPIGRAPIAQKSPGTNGTLRTPPSSSGNSNSKILRTPTNIPNIPAQMLGGKITPPMCGCGRRAKKNNVVSPGPNQGRTFYSCPNRKGGRSSESALHDSTNKRKQGCGYFKWESVVLREKSSGTPVNYNHTPRSNASTPILQHNKHTPVTVGRLGQSYISMPGMGIGLSYSGSVSRPGGFGKRLGTSPRTVLKPPSL